MKYWYTFQYKICGDICRYRVSFIAPNLMESARMLAERMSDLRAAGGYDFTMPTKYEVEAGVDGPYWQMYDRHIQRKYFIQKAPDHIKRKLRRKNLYAVYKREHGSEIQWLASSYEKAAQWVILNI